MGKLKVEIKADLTESDIEVSFLIYQENIGHYPLSVQTKPVFSKEEYIGLSNNPNIKKILIKIDNRIEGIIFATSDPGYYPESHYSSEYFFSHKNQIPNPRKTIFFIGDRGGINLSKSTKNKIKKTEIKLDILFGEVFSAIHNILGAPYDIIWNQSEHSHRMILMKEPYLDYIDAIRKTTPIQLLDRETFVHIHWMENVFHKSRLIWSLKLAGNFSQDYVNNGISHSSEYLFTTKRFLRKQYHISHYSIVDPELAEKFYQVYHERLNKINEKSPQKLEYDKKDFLEYLSDSRIDKYILWNNSKQIAGGCLLISKNNSNAAHWVTKEWRLADAYIKLIFVNRGEARFAYLLLFAAATYHLLKRQGTVDNSRILADWSDNINGGRFSQALNIRQVPFLPKLIGVPSGMRPDKMFARILISLANFRATLLDNDVYYKISPL